MTSIRAEQILAAGRPLSGKWKLELLYRLSESPARWNELMGCAPNIAPNALTRQLGQLEQDGLIVRRVLSAKPPKVVEYRLSELGRQYVPFLRKLADLESSADTAV